MSLLVLPKYNTSQCIEIVKSEIRKKIEKIIGIISLVLQSEIMRKVGEDPDIRISAARISTLGAVEDTKAIFDIAFTYSPVGDLPGGPPRGAQGRQCHY